MKNGARWLRFFIVESTSQSRHLGSPSLRAVLGRSSRSRFEPTNPAVDSLPDVVQEISPNGSSPIPFAADRDPEYTFSRSQNTLPAIIPGWSQPRVRETDQGRERYAARPWTIATTSPMRGCWKSPNPIWVRYSRSMATGRRGATGGPSVWKPTRTTLGNSGRCV